MGLKNNENSVRSAKLHQRTGTKRREGRNFRGLVQKVSLKEFCEALQNKLL